MVAHGPAGPGPAGATMSAHFPKAGWIRDPRGCPGVWVLLPDAAVQRFRQIRKERPLTPAEREAYAAAQLGPRLLGPSRRARRRVRAEAATAETAAAEGEAPEKRPRLGERPRPGRRVRAGRAEAATAETAAAEAETPKRSRPEFYEHDRGQLRTESFAELPTKGELQAAFVEWGSAQDPQESAYGWSTDGVPPEC